MGTSTSSSGPRSNISLDPPWLDALTGGEGGEGDEGDAQPPEPAPPGNGNPPPLAPQAQIAPARRYASAKRNIGNFVRTGSRESLGRGVGQYSHSGMGGARQAARRMRASTHGGAGLVSFLQEVANRATPEARRWVDELNSTAPSFDDVVDAIVNAVMPPAGSVDEESMRDSMALALSELVVLDPSCDLLQMRPDDTWTLMQLYLGQEVCNRIRFDAGQFFESARLNPALAVQREIEMREFIRNEVGTQLRSLRAVHPNPTKQQLDSIMQDALRLTFEVYEGML
jgi:hypothetical protein